MAGVPIKSSPIVFCCSVKLTVVLPINPLPSTVPVAVDTVSDRTRERIHFRTHPVAVTANYRTFEDEHMHTPLLPTLTFLILQYELLTELQCASGSKGRARLDKSANANCNEQKRGACNTDDVLVSSVMSDCVSTESYFTSPDMPLRTEKTDVAQSSMTYVWSN
jgi:hypothetical protein